MYMRENITRFSTTVMFGLHSVLYQPVEVEILEVPVEDVRERCTD